MPIDEKTKARPPPFFYSVSTPTCGERTQGRKKTMAKERAATIGRYPVKEMGAEIEVEHYDSEDQRTTYVYFTVDELNGMLSFMAEGKV